MLRWIQVQLLLKTVALSNNHSNVGVANCQLLANQLCYQNVIVSTAEKQLQIDQISLEPTGPYKSTNSMAIQDVDDFLWIIGYPLLVILFAGIFFLNSNERKYSASNQL